MSTPFYVHRHSHIFSQVNPTAERKTRITLLITLLVMLAEITGGISFNSMALLADGWHMSSHVLALGLSLFAWRLARYYAHDSRFSFGSWKIEVLGGYTSAVLLAVIAILMIWESLVRLWQPQPIFYNQAMAIASIGLLVNLVCAWLLHDEHGHHQHNHHQHSHHGSYNKHQHHDLNLRAAYLHVLADAATSILAIAALAGGKFFHVNWLDPLMGIIGALVVISWAYTLVRDTGKVLLDAEMDSPLIQEIRHVIATSSSLDTITDLHIWRVGKEHYACIIALISQQNRDPEYYREQLSQIAELAHITVEINPNNQANQRDYTSVQL